MIAVGIFLSVFGHKTIFMNNFNILQNYVEDEDANNLTEFDVDVDLVQQESTSKLLTKFAKMLKFLKAELSMSNCKDLLKIDMIFICFIDKKDELIKNIECENCILEETNRKLEVEMKTHFV